MTDPAPGSLLDRYVVVGALGRGGMASVTHVRHRDLGTDHALKLLTREHPGLRERLLFEGRAQARLSHPNVCRVSDVIRVGERVGLVMDLARGPSLEELLVRLTPNLLQLDWLADGILCGVHAAHEAGVIHRDLKPGNVLIDVVNGVVVPRVTDFGIARALDAEAQDRRTREGVAMFTPAFMAPEQYRDARTADRRSDVFSLGALLYELATGTPAFFGDTPFQIYEAAAAGRFRPLDAVAPGLPERVRDAITRALDPDPARRFDTVEALRAAWFRGAPRPEPGAFEPSHVAWITARSHARAPSAPTGTLAPPADPPPPSPPPTPAAPALPARRSRAAWVAAAVVLAGSVGLIAASVGVTAAVGAGWWWSAGGSTGLDRSVAASLAEPPAPEESDRAPAGPAPADPAPTPGPAAPAPAPASPARAAPAPAAPRPGPPKPEPAATNAEVAVSGVDRALLVQGDQRLRPGEVPPGRWSVVVFFDDGQPTTVSELTLAAGDRRELRCDRKLKVCR